MEEFFAPIETQFRCAVALPVLAAPLEVLPHRDRAFLIGAGHCREFRATRNSHALTPDHIFHLKTSD
jgi:hypothetical protein